MAKRRPYPSVLGELETLKLVVSGKSISRYGDGEFKMCNGAGIKSQDGDGKLQRRLREILHESGECLVGIPNIDAALSYSGPSIEYPQKADFWRPKRCHANLLVDRPYVSSFITRPDSAPWVDTPEYWALLESLWIGQEVTLVRGSGKSFTGDRLMEWGAKKVTEVTQLPAYNGKPQHAWFQYDDLLKRIGTPDRALLCLGPTATVMAVDLCAKGVHAIDLGHAGMFVRKHKEGVSLNVLPEDRMLPA